MHVRARVLPLLGTAALSIGFMAARAPASTAPTLLEAALKGGTAEVPDPGDPDGSGAAQVTINVDKQRLCFAIAVVDISLPSVAAHIHKGAAGTAGDIAITLKPPVDVAATGIGLSRGCVGNLSKALLRTILKSPSQYYVNVHNAEFPGGAVRGQLAVPGGGGGGGGGAPGPYPSP